MTIKEVFAFPDHVNMVSARLVAGGVMTMALAAILFDLKWMTLVILYGFLARTAAGPRFSPLALLVTRVITPRLPFKARMVPGAPKRFVQAIGAVCSLMVVALAYPLDRWLWAKIFLAGYAGFAFMEAFFGYCPGCRIYSRLIRKGIISADRCPDCLAFDCRSAA